MIKVGIIGFGYAARTFHLPLIESCSTYCLTAISSSQSSLAFDESSKLTIFPTALALIHANTVDLVIITSPNDTHFELAKAALEAGLHVVIEKPMTNTAAEAIALCAMAKARNLILTVFQNRRWDGDFMTISKLLDQQAIGELRVFESHFDRFRPKVRNRWRENPGLGAGIWYDLGPHLVDQAVCLFGAPESVTAELKMLRENSLNIDYFHVQFHYSCFEVILHSNPYNAAPNLRFQLFGTEASFVKSGLDPQEQQLISGMHPCSTGYGLESKELHGKIYTENSNEIVATTEGNYQTFYHLLADCISRGSPPPVEPMSAALVIQLIEHAMRANELGQRLVFTDQHCY